MSFTKQLKSLLHPYVFILKEGNAFTEDSMSYDLMILQVNDEVIKSPTSKKKVERTAQERLNDLKVALPRTLNQVRGLEDS